MSVSLQMMATSISRFKQEGAANSVPRKPTKLTSKTISSNPYWSKGPLCERLIKEIGKRTGKERSKLQTNASRQELKNGDEAEQNDYQVGEDASQQQ